MGPRYRPGRDPMLEQWRTVLTLTDALTTNLTSAAEIPYEATDIERNLQTNHRDYHVRLRLRSQHAVVAAYSTIGSMIERVATFRNHVDEMRGQHEQDLNDAREAEFRKTEETVKNLNGVNTTLQTQLGDAQGNISSLQHALEVAAARFDVTIDKHTSLQDQLAVFSGGVSSKRGGDKHARERELDEFKKGIAEELQTACNALGFKYNETVSSRTVLSHLRNEVQIAYVNHKTTQEKLGALQNALEFIKTGSKLSPYCTDLDVYSIASLSGVIDTAWNSIQAQASQGIYNEVSALVVAFCDAHRIVLSKDSSTVALVQSIVSGADDRIATRDSTISNINKELKEAIERHGLSVLSDLVTIAVYVEQMDGLLASAQTSEAGKEQARVTAEQTLENVLNVIEVSRNAINDVDFSPTDNSSPAEDKATSYVEGVATKLDLSRQHFRSIDLFVSGTAPSDDAMDVTPSSVDSEKVLASVIEHVNTLVEQRDTLVSDRDAFDRDFASTAQNIQVDASTDIPPAVRFTAYRHALEAKVEQLQHETTDTANEFNRAMSDLDHSFEPDGAPKDKREAFVRDVRERLQGLQVHISETKLNVKSILAGVSDILDQTVDQTVEDPGQTVEGQVLAAAVKLRELNSENRDFLAALDTAISTHGLDVSEHSVGMVVEAIIRLRDQAVASQGELQDRLSKKLTELEADAGVTTGVQPPDLEARIAALLYHVDHNAKTQVEQLQADILEAAKKVRELVDTYLAEIELPPAVNDALTDSALLESRLEIELGRLRRGYKSWADNECSVRDTSIGKLHDTMLTVLHTFACDTPTALGNDERVDENTVFNWADQCRDRASGTARTVHDQATLTATGTSQYVSSVVFELRDFAHRAFTKARVSAGIWPVVDDSDIVSIRAFTAGVIDNLEKGLQQNARTAEETFGRKMKQERKELADMLMPSIMSADEDYYYSQTQLEPPCDNFQDFAVWFDIRFAHFCRHCYTQRKSLATAQRTQLKAEQAIGSLFALVNLAIANMRDQFRLGQDAYDTPSVADFMVRPDIASEWLRNRTQPLIETHQATVSANQTKLNEERMDMFRVVTRLKDVVAKAGIYDVDLTTDIHTIEQLHTKCTRSLPRLGMIIETIRGDLKRADRQKQEQDVLMQLVLQRSKEFAMLALDKQANQLATAKPNTDDISDWFQARTNELRGFKSVNVVELEDQICLLLDTFRLLAVKMNEKLYAADTVPELPALHKGSDVNDVKMWQDAFTQWAYESTGKILNIQAKRERKLVSGRFLESIQYLGREIAKELEPVHAQCLEGHKSPLKLELTGRFQTNIGQIKRHVANVAEEIAATMDRSSEYMSHSKVVIADLNATIEEVNVELEASMGMMREELKGEELLG